MGDTNLRATFGYVAAELGRRKLAFLCARESLAEPRLGPALKKAFGGVYIVNEGFTVGNRGGGFNRRGSGRCRIWQAFHRQSGPAASPRAEGPLNSWNGATFYSAGGEGYTDYPQLAEAAE